MGIRKAYYDSGCEIRVLTPTSGYVIAHIYCLVCASRVGLLCASVSFDVITVFPYINGTVARLMYTLKNIRGGITPGG